VRPWLASIRARLAQRPRRADQRADLAQRAPTVRRRVCDQPQVIERFGRQEQFMACSGRAHRRRQQAVHGFELAGEAQLAVAFERSRAARLELPGGEQQAERDRQVEAAAFLLELDRREVDRDASGREVVA
jgi:hypothetical protein